jgi:phosphohistidine swiveling domain-containing protein
MYFVKKPVALITPFVWVAFLAPMPVDAATINVPADYVTIQQAINAATDSDTVLVAPGVYNESINFLGKAIAVTSSDGPLTTIITSDPSSDLVTFNSDEAAASVLEGFRLEGGWMAVHCADAAPTIRHNILVNQNVTNWAAISLGGDGFASVGVSPAVIVNNTIVGCANGGISTFSTEAPTIKNTIIAFNSHYGIHREALIPGVAQPDLSYNDVFGNFESYQEIADSGIGTISANPLFGAKCILLSGSPCIDAGDPDPVYNDPDGTRNDMGALPFDTMLLRSPTTLHVPSEYPTIQSAIDVSFYGDTVLVAAGTYIENITFSGQSIVLLSESGPEVTVIQAPSSEEMALTPPADMDTTTAGKSGTEYQLAAEAAAPSAVITLLPRSDSTTVIAGFTINGNDETRGIYGLGSDVEVSNCIIERCLGPYDGGGIFFEHCAPLIKDNIIRACVTPITGGGVFIRLGYGFGTARVIGNKIYGNVAGNGAAIGVIQGDHAVVERNLAYNNSATFYSLRRGAVVCANVETVTVVNNTINYNTVGLSVLSSVSVDVRNNIIANNRKGGFESLTDMGSNIDLTYDYNNVWNNAGADYIDLTPAPNDLSVDPLFEPTLYGEFYLTDVSPCIDAGDPDPEYNDPDGTRNDMGARPYEDVMPRIPGIIKVPADYSTIQAAINAAYNDDTVLVAPGTYEERLNFLGKQIYVISEEGPLQTIITTDELKNLVTFIGAETEATVLEGFRLEGGWIGILCAYSGPTVRRNLLINQQVTNWAAISIGGLWLYDPPVGETSPVIVNNTIIGCMNGGISTFSTVSPTVKNTIIAFNGHYGIHREGIIPGIAQPGLSYNDVYGNPESYQEIADSGIGTIAADPLFNPNHTLQYISPCVDAGDPDPSYNDPDGSPADMGALFAPGICGDIDGDLAGPDITDLTYLVDYLFRYGPPPPYPDQANVNGQHGVNVADVTYLVDYLFQEGLDPNCWP